MNTVAPHPHLFFSLKGIPAGMKICFVFHSSQTGGAERVLLETIEILQGKGIECRAILPGPGEMCTRLSGLGIPFRVISHPWWADKGMNPLSHPKRTLTIAIKAIVVAKAISAWKCDIVYTNTVTIPVGALACRLLGLRHIWHLHEFGREHDGMSFVLGERLSHKLIGKLSDVCICVSSALARKYSRHIDSSKLTVVYPSMHRTLECVDHAPLEASLGTAAYRCVIAGALSDGKGQKEGLLALASLRKRGIDAELIIVGGGEPAYLGILKETVRSKGLSEHVVFLGQVPDAFPVIQKADCLLVCSRSEGFGRVTVEGMLAGKPVIGARSGATSELIVDGVNGLLYKCGDPEDLAEKIKYLIENPSVGKRLGRVAQSAARSYFTAARHEEAMLDVIMRLSGGPGRPKQTAPHSPPRYFRREA